MKILIIDDEADIRTIARLSLERIGGMEVLEASSGPEGIACAAGDRPDAVLLDLMMPGMDGAAVLGALRARADTARIPLVFLTAKASAPDIERLRALGAAGVIIKPFDPMTLADRVRSTLAAAAATGP